VLSGTGSDKDIKNQALRGCKAWKPKQLRKIEGNWEEKGLVFGLFSPYWGYLVT
jgi:hypothetical protein